MAKTETAWLIELDIPLYVYVDPVTYTRAKLGFTSDHSKALRFARKEDAEAAIGLLDYFGLCLPEGSKGAVEHSWIDTPGQFDSPIKQAYPSGKGSLRDRIKFNG